MFGSSQVKAPYDVSRVYNMLYPKPKELLANSTHRKIVREGELGVYNANERRTKRRYFFLFNDVLLLTKKEGSTKFWLKVYISLRSNIRIEDVPDSPTPNKVEFRLYSPKKTIILFAHSQYDKEAWIQDIRRCTELASGGRGMAGEPLSTTTTTTTTTIIHTTSSGPSHSSSPSSHGADQFSNPSFERRTNVPQYAPTKDKEVIKLGSDIGKLNLQIGSPSSSSSSASRSTPLNSAEQQSQVPLDLVTVDQNDDHSHGKKPVEFYGDDDDEFAALAGRNTGASSSSASPAVSHPSFAAAPSAVQQPQMQQQQLPPAAFANIDLLQAFPSGTMTPQPQMQAAPSAFSAAPVGGADPFSALRGANPGAAGIGFTTTPMVAPGFNFAAAPQLAPGTQTFTLPPIGTFPVIPGMPMLFNPATPGVQPQGAANPLFMNPNPGLMYNPSAPFNPNPNPQ